MQVTVTDSGTLRKTLTITYAAPEVAARRATVLRQLAQEVKLPGFRPGKVSAGLVEKRYGQAATAHMEEQLSDEGLKKAIGDNQLKPVGAVTTESLDRSGGLTLVVSFEVRPTIALPADSELTVTREAVTIADGDLDEQIKGLCRRAGTMGPLAADELIIEDDSITVSGTISVAGAEVRKLHDFNHLVGGYPFFGKVPADVVALLKDKKTGDAVTFTTTLPASFTPAEHANKEGQIAVTIQAANRLRAAEANDELAKRVGAPSMEALKEMMKARLLGSRETALRTKQINELTEQLLAKVQCELPPKVLASTLKDAETNADERIKSQKLEGADADKARADAKDESVKSLKRFVILDVLAEQLGIQVDRQDLEDQIRMAGAQTGRKPEEIAKQLQTSGRTQQVVHEIREAKALETLLDRLLGDGAASAAKG